MKSKKRILIAGIGGVGGYIGAMLAKYYEYSEDIEVCFYARGENLKKIQQDGLLLRTDIGEIHSKPYLVSNNPNELGIADYIICTMKSYDIEEAINQLRPCINSTTIILPLLNGVESTTKIKTILPDVQVCEGCIYIVTRIVAPGVILQSGKVNAIYFGSKFIDIDKLNAFYQILKLADLNITLSPNIESVIWEKYVFISAIASLTSYLNKGIGFILNADSDRDLLLKLLEEVILIAKYQNIQLSIDLVETILNRLKGLPEETTSSMQLDFSLGKKTELESLTGMVVRKGQEYKIATPSYDLVYSKLKSN